MAVTTAAVIGVASSAAGTIQSFSQSAKQGDLAEKAAAQAKKSMAEAKSRAEKNYYAGLNVSRESYDKAFENNLQVQTQNIQALQEGDPRNLAAGVGLVQQAADASTDKTRLVMQKDLEANAKMKADAQDAINQDLKRMDLGLAKDSEKMAQEASAASAAAFSQGISGLGSTAMQASQLSPLFGGDALTPEEQIAYDNLMKAKAAGQ